MKYLKYLWYVIRHKYYVLVECFKVGLYLRGVLHDISKLYPSEFTPYANHFYGKKGKENAEKIKSSFYDPNKDSDDKFQWAWHYHSSRNKHHWQYWITPTVDKKLLPIKIPEVYLIEMLCDWEGAKKAKGTTISVEEWYEQNKNSMTLHIESRKRLEELIEQYKISK